jgi:hypothetical protein
MRMKLISGLIMAVAFGASAHATQFVTNGNFSSVSTTSASGSFEFDPAAPSGAGTVTGWAVVNPAGETSYNILYNTSTATTGAPVTRFGTSTAQGLWALPSNTASMGIGSNFIALDGDRGDIFGANAVQGELQQQITGLTAGTVYTLTFDFAAGQLQSRTGATTEVLDVSMSGTHGTQSFQTDGGTPLADATKSATPWELETFTFTATDSTELLKFLSVGTPDGEPPMALLDNVSLVNTVPEPATWGLMLLGVGAIGASLRMRRRTAATLA